MSTGTTARAAAGAGETDAAVAVVHELPELRDRARVFRDRTHAGRVLAGMLESLRGSDALVLAIPSGGVPVGAALAAALGLPLDVAVASKILLPWTTEAGFGAIAFDGSAWVDTEAAARFGLSQAAIEDATRQAREKVARRVMRFRGGRPSPSLTGRTLLLVDDGIAAGSTLRAALAALRRQGAKRTIVAVPTGPWSSLEALRGELHGEDELYCANVRTGYRFAVADAYEAWCEVSEEEALALLRPVGG